MLTTKYIGATDTVKLERYTFDTSTPVADAGGRVEHDLFHQRHRTATQIVVTCYHFYLSGFRHL
jgi:hypothetical protein